MLDILTKYLNLVQSVSLQAMMQDHQEQAHQPSDSGVDSDQIDDAEAAEAAFAKSSLMFEIQVTFDVDTALSQQHGYIPLLSVMTQQWELPESKPSNVRPVRPVLSLNQLRYQGLKEAVVKQRAALGNEKLSSIQVGGAEDTEQEQTLSQELTDFIVQEYPETAETHIDADDSTMGMGSQVEEGAQKQPATPPAENAKPEPSSPIPPRKPWQKPRPIVNSLKEAFDFWDNAIDVLCDNKDDEECHQLLGKLASELEEDSLSTAFSGIGAPETATNVTRYRLGKRLGRDLKHKHASLGHMVEWKTSSQEECKLIGKHHGCCVFGDIGQFFRQVIKDGVLKQIIAKPQVAVSLLTPLILSGQAMSTHGDCLVHGKKCAMKTCNRHVAGTSCRPFSRRGAGLSTSDGDMIYTLAWAGLRRVLQEPDLTQENVEGCPVELIDGLLGDLYFIDKVVIDSSSTGTPAARRRQFLRLRHKVRILSETSPISTFAKRFFRAVSFHWSEYFAISQWVGGAGFNNVNVIPTQHITKYRFYWVCLICFHFISCYKRQDEHNQLVNEKGTADCFVSPFSGITTSTSILRRLCPLNKNWKRSWNGRNAVPKVRHMAVQG